MHFPDLPVKHSAGGYMCVYVGVVPGLGRLDVDEPPYAIFRVGAISSSDMCPYYELSQEKALRLMRGVVNDGTNHVSSWQSRRPENNQWGGAVRDEDTILSFSGLTEHADEALTLLVAMENGLMSPEAAEKIAQMSDNKFFSLVRGS